MLREDFPSQRSRWTIPSSGSVPNHQMHNSPSPSNEERHQYFDSRIHREPIRNQDSNFYSKRQLMAIYRDLQKSGNLHCPIERLPSILGRRDAPLAMEVSFEEKWIIFHPDREPYLSVMSSQQAKNQIKIGNIRHNHQLLPWSEFEKHARTGRDVEAAFDAHEQEDLIEKRRRYKSSAVEKRQVTVRQFFIHGPTPKMVESLDIYYRDRSSKLQGPFSKDSIIDWWKQGLFPDDLKISFGKRCPFVYLDAIMGQWFASIKDWCVLDNHRAPQTMPISRLKLIELFLCKRLRFDMPIIPWELCSSNRGLPLLHLMVHCLPWSDYWLITDSCETDILPIKEAYAIWRDEYGTDGHDLLARPSTWDCSFHIPIEFLLDSYGFLE